MDIAFTGKVSGNRMEGTREIKSSGGSSGPGGAAGGAAPQGGGAQGEAPPQGGMPGGGQGAPEQGAGQGGVSTDGHENFVAVKN